MKILGPVVAVLLGALFAGLGTVAHQIEFSAFGAVDLPVGLVIALVALALMMTGLRLTSPSRLWPSLAGLGAVATVALFALESPGGSVLIPASPIGLVWLFGSTLVVVVVVAWPRLGPRPPAHPVPRPDAVDSTW
ncbi:hypothetical protein [Herbiconiux liangxiaofengii]|uniref:hypothetical protein n=1 Tax=Herbiconiux liangxiaofengii TaxID=3342795 RepID=UPI0035B71F58